MRSLIIIITLFCLGCSSSSSSEQGELNKLAKAYELQPNAERAIAYLDKASEYISQNKENFSLVSPVLKQASDFAIGANMPARASGFLMAQVKESTIDTETIDDLIQLGTIMKSLNKPHASNIIFKGLQERFPNDPKVTAKSTELTSEITSAEGYLNFLFDQVLVNPDEYGINRMNALKFVDGTEAFALTLPKNNTVPEFLYKAGEVARSLRTMPKAMNLYDWILEKYPNHEKAPTTLFIKGFLLEQEFGQVEEAKVVYEKFLKEYPKHEMASSAKFLLSNMGKSDEEILQEIEKKREENKES